MAADDESPMPRTLRADAQRNRMRLLAAAKPILAEKGRSASLDEIAQKAGVGIGTLYRHFPTRDALVQAVYLNETQQLAEAAERLGETRPPVEALREWMLLFVDYLETKHVIADMLNTLRDGTSDLYAVSTVQITTAITVLVARAEASGEIRVALDPLDLLRAVAGMGSESGKRVVDILIAGMRT